MIIQQTQALYTKGFTLIEVLVVTAIFIILAAAVLSTDTTSLHRYSFRDDQGTLVGSLQKIRNESMNGVCFGDNCVASVSHGLHIENTRYTIFQGDTYNSSAAENIVVQLNPAENLSGLSDVIFQKISGDASTSPQNIDYIILKDSVGHVCTTTILDDGQIDFTN